MFLFFSFRSPFSCFNFSIETIQCTIYRKLQTDELCIKCFCSINTLSHSVSVCIRAIDSAERITEILCWMTREKRQKYFSTRFSSRRAIEGRFGKNVKKIDRREQTNRNRIHKMNHKHASFGRSKFEIAFFSVRFFICNDRWDWSIMLYPPPSVFSNSFFSANTSMSSCYVGRLSVKRSHSTVWLV